MKNLIVVVGGAGFVGSNLIEYLLIKTKKKILSLDNYSTGSRKNEIKNKRVKYIKANSAEIKKVLFKHKRNINALFHFGEFSRIFQSFKHFDECYQSNTIGSMAVFKFCLDNNIRLIYSATSATLGNNGNDKNLSPYAFTKSQNLELLQNLKNWFNFKNEIIYFYNVYGPRQICDGHMATVVGIFEKHYLENKKLPIVKPGTQTRRFTHINDTIKVCYEAWKTSKNRHYSISNSKSYSIIDLAKMFNSKVKFLSERKGERFASSLTRMNLSNKVHKRMGKIDIKNYINDFIKKNPLK